MHSAPTSVLFSRAADFPCNPGSLPSFNFKLQSVRFVFSARFFLRTSPRRKMQNVVSMSDPPRTVMVSPTGDSMRPTQGVSLASPYPARPGVYASPGEIVVTATRPKPGVRTGPATPQLLRAARDIRGAVDIMVFGIKGFTDSADVMGKTDPYVR